MNEDEYVRMGELSALQISADVHARAMRYSEMVSALEKALRLAEQLGDTQTLCSAVALRLRARSG